MRLRPRVSRTYHVKHWYNDRDHPWMNRFCYIGTVEEYYRAETPDDVKRNFEIFVRTNDIRQVVKAAGLSAPFKLD